MYYLISSNFIPVERLVVDFTFCLFLIETHHRDLRHEGDGDSICSSCIMNRTSVPYSMDSDTDQAFFGALLSEWWVET